MEMKMKMEMEKAEEVKSHDRWCRCSRRWDAQNNGSSSEGWICPEYLILAVVEVRLPHLSSSRVAEINKPPKSAEQELERHPSRHLRGTRGPGKIWATALFLTLLPVSKKTQSEEHFCSSFFCASGCIIFIFPSTCHLWPTSGQSKCIHYSDRTLFVCHLCPSQIKICLSPKKIY